MSYEVGKLTCAQDLLAYCDKNAIGLTFDDMLLEPQYSEIESRKNIDIQTWVTPLRELDAPIIAANMDTVCESKMAIAMKNAGALGVIHRYMTHEKQLEEMHKVSFDNGLTNTVTAAAVGVKNGVIEHVKKLVEQGCKIVVIDVAHGHHKVVGDLIRELKKLNLMALDELPVEYIAGNVAMPQGVKYLCEQGADAIKVGIGPGSICSTRLVTGHGIPQAIAVAACSLMAARYNRTIIADGGIKTSGDIVKAIALGATTVMCGSIFAGTDCSPGEEIFEPSGARYKLYRGMASREAQEEFYGNSPDAPEGVTVRVPYTGTTEHIIKTLKAGIQSGLSYSGVDTIAKLQDKASWLRISNSGLRESKTL